MSGSDMFVEFVDILNSVFNFIFISKYSWLLIAVIVSLGGSLLLYLLRWFINA